MNKFLSLNDWNLISNKLLSFLGNANESTINDDVIECSITESNIQMNIQWMKRNKKMFNFLQLSESMTIFPYFLNVHFSIRSNLDQFKDYQSNINELRKIPSEVKTNSPEKLKINLSSSDHKLENAIVRVKRIDVDDFKTNQNESENVPLITLKRTFNDMQNDSIIQGPLQEITTNVSMNRSISAFSDAKYSTPKPKSILESGSLLRNELSCIPILEENENENDCDEMHAQNDDNQENCIDETPVAPIKKTFRKIRPLYLQDSIDKTHKKLSKKTLKSKLPKKFIKMSRKKEKKVKKRIVTIYDESSLFENKNKKIDKIVPTENVQNQSL